jgi:hypothetical protein
MLRACRKRFFGVPGFFSNIGEKAHIAKDVFATLKSMNRMMEVSSRLEEAHGGAAHQGEDGSSTSPDGSTHTSPRAGKSTMHTAGGNGDEDDVVLTQERRQKLEQEAQEAAMGAFWRLTKMDVETALRTACDAVLYDPTVSDEVQEYRAKAMRIIASVFLAVTPVAAATTSTTASSSTSSTSTAS